jgi:hypothetical protein
MERCVILMAAITGAAIAACALVAAVHDCGLQTPVYSLATIERQLGSTFPRQFRQPVWVRGVAKWCGADIAAGQAGGEQCMHMPPMLADAADEASPALPLILGSSPGLPTLLSRLPAVGTWLRRSRTLLWGQVAVYRIALVRIRVSPIQCLRRPCYAAHLTSSWG